MQPSINWGADFVRLFGANIRSGVSDIDDPDFTSYPAFHFNQIDTYPGNSYMHVWWLHFNVFPLNQPINDWSIAYTGVYSTELSHTNIGVFDSTDFTEPKYKTDNTAIQQIAFLNNLRYTINVTDHGARPQWSGAPQFPVPPYNNNLYVYSPNAAGGNVDPDTFDLSQVNFNGYATTIRSFGIKSWFLEIRVSTVFTGGENDSPLPNADYSLKEYLAFAQNIRDTNPISRAFARVYIRSSTAGTYNYRASDFWQFYPVLSIPFSGNDVNNIYCYFNLVNSEINQTNDLELPLFGIPCNRSTFSNRIYTTPQNGFLDFFYGYDHISGVTNITSDNCVFYMDATEENIEYLRKCCAAYGLFFCDSVITSDNKDLSGGALEANNGRWLHNDMYLGIIEESGYTEGRYTRGVLNGMQAQFSWNDSTDSTYDPAYPPVPENEYNTETVFNTVSGISTMTQRYALTAGAVKNLGTALWSISSELIDDGGGGTDYSELNQKILDTFLTNNPIDCIVSLRKFPFEISKDDSTLVKLGKYETLVGGYTVSKTIDIFEFRMNKKVLPLFNDSFMDYEPYTHFELYVPFCGTVSVEPADILGRSLSVRLAVDYSTGTCTAYILSDSLVIKTISGQIAIDIPVSGIQSVTAASQINNAIAQASTAHKQERSATLGNVSVGGAVQFMINPVKTIESAGIAENAAQRADYELQHQTIQPHLIGSASSAAAWLIDFSCRLLIYYPTGEVLFNTNPPSFNPLKLLEYGHTVGFACCNTGTLSSFSGLTVAVRADLNNITTNGLTARPATLQELQMLEDALNEGVII